jgi:hypothetical protein
VYDIVVMEKVELDLEDVVLVSSVNGVFKKEKNIWKKIEANPVNQIEKLEKNKIVWANSEKWGIRDANFSKNIQIYDLKQPLRIIYTAENNIYLVYIDGQIEKRNGNNAAIIWNYTADKGNRFKNPNEIVKVNNELLIAYQNGFLSLDDTNGKPIHNSPFQILSSEGSVLHLYSENENELWVQSHHNLIRFTQKDSNWVKESVPFAQVAYDQAVNGMIRNKQGLWLSTTKNLWVFDPENLPKSIPFTTRISEVRLKNDSLYRAGFGEFPEKNIFSYQNNELRIRFAAPIFWDESRTLYRYKLVGDSDENWSQWTQETQKDYTNLFEGNYTFIVEAKDLYEVIGKEAKFNFRILPPWYRTWWAFLIYIVLTGLSFYTIYSWRIAQIMKEVHLRNKIAGDLHDEVSATLSSITFFAKALNMSRPEIEKQKYVNLISESAGDAKEKITDIVWAVNPEYDNWNSFLAKIKRYISDILQSASIQYDLSIPESFDRKLSMNVRHQFWLVIKEIITNSIRHSKCTTLSVRLQFKEYELIFIVQDNGIGISNDKLSGNNGLKNIKKRVEIIHGKANLSTDSEFGTRWEIHIPL